MAFDAEDEVFRRNLRDAGFKILDMEHDGNSLFQSILTVVRETGMTAFDSVVDIQRAISDAMDNNVDVTKIINAHDSPAVVPDGNFWKSHVSVMVAALLWRTNYTIINPTLEKFRFPEQPFRNSNKPVFLSFHKNFHYNLLEEQHQSGDPNVTERFQSKSKVSLQPSDSSEGHGSRKRKVEVPQISNPFESDEMDLGDEEDDATRAIESDVNWKRHKPQRSCGQMVRRKLPEEGDIKISASEENKAEKPHSDVASTSFIQNEKPKKAKPLQTTSMTVNMFIPKINLSKMALPIKTSDSAAKEISPKSSTSTSTFTCTSGKHQDDKEERYNQTAVSPSDEMYSANAANSCPTKTIDHSDASHQNNEYEKVDHYIRSDTAQYHKSGTTSPVENKRNKNNRSDFEEQNEYENTFQEEAPSIQMSPSDMDIASPPSTSVASDSIINCKNDKQVNNSSQWGFQCDICGVTCENQTLLTSHKICVHEVMKTCKVCGKEFWSTQDLKDHQKKDHDAYAFECGICGKTFPTEPNLVTHFETHETEGCWTCNICGSKYKSKYPFLKHIRRHLTRAQEQCESKQIATYYTEAEQQPVEVSRNDISPYAEQVTGHKDSGTAEMVETKRTTAGNPVTNSVHTQSIENNNYNEESRHHTRSQANCSIIEASKTHTDCDSLLRQTGECSPLNEVISGVTSEFIQTVYKEGSTSTQDINFSGNQTSGITKKFDVVLERNVEKLLVNDNQELGDQSPIKTPTENQLTDKVDKEEEGVIYLEVPDFSELDSSNRKGGAKKKKEVDDDDWCPEASQEKPKTRKRRSVRNKNVTTPRVRKKSAGIVAENPSQKPVDHKNSTKCHVCGKCFPSPEILECHRIVLHSGRNVCEICSQWFPNKTLKKKHITEHHDGFGYKCKLCEKTFRTNSKLWHYMATHKVGRTYKCPVCGYICDWKPNAISHFEETHFPPTPQADTEKDADESETPCVEVPELTVFTCKICQMSFPTGEILEYHVMLRHYDHTYCKLCNIKFKTMAERRAHDEITHKNCTQICEICGKECKDLRKLKEHMRGHNPETPHACPACPKKYKFKSRLTRHISMQHLAHVNHNEETNIERSNKGKKQRKSAGGSTRAEKSNLKKKGAVKKLLQETNNESEANIGRPNTMEGEPSTRNDSKKAFACYVCGTTYAHKNTLQQHFEAKHHEGFGIKWKCKLCGRVFCTELLMVRHYCKIVNKPKYTCNVCGKSFRGIQYFRKHNEQGHKGH